jgi:glutathione synthase/RimK-type ligase-like ATP-grasp enzyme
VKRVSSLTLGIRHNDFQETAEAVRQHGVELVPFNIEKQSLNDIYLGQFSAVELRHCRGWQSRWDQLEPVLRRLEQDGIPSINPPATFRWVLNKAAYLSELRENGIATIPTAVVRQGDRAELQDYLHDGNHHHVVLKPERGARGTGTRFVKRLNKGLFEVAEPYPEGNNIQSLSGVQLERRFAL